MQKLENRLIAFLDVLGFSHLLSVNSLEVLYEKYSCFITKAKNETFFHNENDPMKRTNFEFARFISDSLILISHPTSDIYNVNNFLMAISRLLSLSFQEKFPLRGAIILGNVILDDENGIVLSKEIPLLLTEEKKQEWVGCTVVENAQNIIFDAVGGDHYKDSIIKNPTQSDLIQFYPVPTKLGTINSFVLNYAYSLSNSQQEKGLSYLKNPKQKNVKNYFDFFKMLPLDQTISGPDNMKLVKTRSGFSISIIND